MYRTAVAASLLIAALCFAVPAGAEEAVGDPYSLNVCPVSGEALGSMGDPIVYVHEGREIRFCCSGCEPRFKADAAKYLAKVDEQMIEQQDDYYPLDVCPVSGKGIDANAETQVIANREMKFCCANCPKAAANDPEKYIAKLDEAVIAEQSENYKLDKCPVSGEELGSMGDPVNMVVANRLIKLCCAGCEKQVNKVPAKYLAALDGKKIEEGSDHK